jgi:hypothetical protein
MAKVVVPHDLDNDGKISERERATAILGNSVMERYKDRDPIPSKRTKEKHREMDYHMNRAGVAKHHLDMFEHDEDEVIVAEIRKHPIGLFAIWTATAIAIGLIWVATAALTYNSDDVAGSANISTSNLTNAGIGIGVCLTLLALTFGYIAAFLYVNNRIIVTSEKLVQIRYFSLFNRKVSSLSIGDVQDTTVQKKGFLPMIFNYGTLEVETSGEQDNFTFPMAVNAEENAKIVVRCHEENLKQYGN